MSLTKVTFSMIDGAVGNVLDYGADPTGVADSAAAFQACVTANKAIYVPAGTYRVNSTITKTNIGSISVFGDGMGVSVIQKYGDSDLFDLSNSGSSSGQISISDLTLAPAADMVTGAALNLRNDSTLPSVRLKNLFIGAAATNEFKYGVRLQNCTEAIMEGVVCYGLGTSKFVAFDVTATVAATVPKWFGCSVYNALYGVNITNSTNPGVEGVQFYGCDIVGVYAGVRYRNTFGPTYFPPQIEWIGGHINAGFRNIDIETASQIIVQGALLYNSGNPGDFIRLRECSDWLIANNEFVAVGGAAAGVVLSTSAEPVNGGIITNNKFSINGGANCVLLDASKIINNILIEGNQRISGAAMFAVIGGTMSSSVVIKNNFPLDQDDVFQSLTVTNATPSLVGLRSNYITVGAASPITVTSLTARYLGDRVTLYAGASNITLQSNSTNPNGFLLKGNVDFVFSANTSITLVRANGGYWTEIARSA